MYSDKPLKLRIFLFLFLISLIIYANSLNGDFLFDDKMLIVDNEFIKHIRTIPLLFKTQVFNFSFYNIDVGYNYYRPLQNLVSAVDYHIWKLNPIGYHLTNVIIHCLNAFLVFLLIYRLFSNYPLALLSSVLFCAHPIQTESVSYIAGRSELLVSLFCLSSVVFYIKYIDSRKGIIYLISILSFILALLSREAGFLLLVPFFILFTAARFKLKRTAAISHFVTFSGVLAIYILLRLTTLVPIRALPYSPNPFLLNIGNFINVLSEYIKLLLFPHSLHILRSIESASYFGGIHALSSTLFLISLFLLVILLTKQKKYPVLFGIGWFFLTSLYLMKSMYKFSSETLAVEEHWIYLPSIGFFIVIAYIILSIKNLLLRRTVAVTIMLILAVLTVTNSGHWRDEISFYRYNLKHIRPNMSVIARLNYVPVLHKHGLYDEAIGQLKYVLNIDPDNYLAYIELGDTLRAMKRFDEAKQAYLEALKIDYFCWQASQALKQLYQELGQEYQDELDPRLSPLEARIISLIRMGNFSEALDVLEKELLTNPSPEFYTLLGIACGKMGLYDKAIDSFNAALKMDPNFGRALYNLAIIYERQKNPKKAAQIRSMFNQSR